VFVVDLVLHLWLSVVIELLINGILKLVFRI